MGICNDVADHPRQSTSKPQIKALSFFTGAMGLDIGLENAGIKILLASEIDKVCRQTIQANHPEIALIGDIRDYTADQVLEAVRLDKSDDIELIVGGPPCQAFSTAGKRKGFEDERGNVFLKFVDLILDLRPKYAVIENVRGLLSAPLIHRPHNQRGLGHPSLGRNEEKGGALLDVIEMLQGGGYGLSFNLYNSANYGSPQIRERVVIVCARDGSKLPYLTPTHSEDGSFGLPKWKTFREAIHDLPDSPKDFINFPERRLQYYRLLKPGQNWRNLPMELQQEALGKSYFAGGGKTGFLRRLAWDRPAPTLVTNPAMPATDLAHPEEDRPLSVQEYKAIQEFPSEWVICGSVLDQYRQIGNAVPVSLGKAVGRLIVSHLKGERITSYQGFRYSRYLGTDHISWEREVRGRLSKPKQITFPFRGGFGSRKAC